MNWYVLVASLFALALEPLPPVSCPQVRVVDTAILDCLKLQKPDCYCSQRDAWKQAETACGATDAVLFVKSKLQHAGCLQ
jgi:hypothetical protein